MGTAIKHHVADRIKPSTVIYNFWHPDTLVLCPERQSAWMSKIINDGLTRSVTGRFFIWFIWPYFYMVKTHMAKQWALKMIGKGFYRKWVKSSFEQFITTQTRVGSTDGWMISQNAEILKFFSTIFGICDVIKWLRFRGCALSLVLQCVYTVNSR